MKKIIISLIIFLLFSNFCFAQEVNEEQNNNIINLKVENNHYKSRVKELDKTLLRKDLEYKKIENKLNNIENDLASLEEKNNILNIENKELQKSLLSIKNKEITKKEKEIIIFNYFKNILGDFKKDINNEEGFTVLFIFYISGAIILYILFLIYTLPLRFLRFIWRKINGYKECSPKLQKDYKNILNQYKKLRNEKPDFSEEKDNLLYQISYLKDNIKTLERININLKKKNKDLKDYKEKNNNSNLGKKEQFTFIKEDNNKSLFPKKDLENKLDENEIYFNFDNLNIGKDEKTDKNEIKNNKFKKANIFGKNKEKTDFLGKKKEKFKLGGNNKKSSIFD